MKRKICGFTGTNKSFKLYLRELRKLALLENNKG